MFEVLCINFLLKCKQTNRMELTEYLQKAQTNIKFRQVISYDDENKNPHKTS